MWKMFSQNTHSGNSPDFWDESWEATDFVVPDRENDRICENQGSLHRALYKVMDRDRLFLEGGCGCATWVRYFSSRGYRAVGIDFAERTVARVKRTAPNADLRIGDVTNMPLEAGSVHCYYSGGVVEHFESGPGPALREARRVMAPDGWFFCSVPDASTLRSKVIYPLQGDRPGAWGRVRRVDATRSESPPEGWQFYQYLFDKQEFSRDLQAAGFEVAETFGYSLLWGLTEIPGIGNTLRVLFGPKSKPGGGSNGVNGHGGSTSPISAIEANVRRAAAVPKRLLRSIFERVALQEDVDAPLIGRPLKLMLEHCSNMRMFVARPR